MEKRLGKNERTVLIAAILLAATAWLFLKIAYHRDSDAMEKFDRTVLLAMRNPSDATDLRGPGWLEETARDLTALGSIGFLLVVVFLATSYLLLKHQAASALYLFGAVGGAILFGTALKYIFQRPRPDLVPHLSKVYTTSFPSGHAMFSAVAFLTLAAILSQNQSEERIRIFSISAAVILTLIVGMSRVYLGVHWPSDVLAGWTAGLFWAILCWLVARIFACYQK